jgi:hypothetical protein
MRWIFDFSRPVFALILWVVTGVCPVCADMAGDIAQVHIEAAGGRKALMALRGLRATGVTRIGGRELPFILYAETPRSLRIETVGEAGTFLRVFDGVHAPWRKRELLERPARLATDEEGDFVAEAEFDDLLLDHEDRGIELEDAGRAEVAGRPCLRLLVTVRLADIYTLYVDEATLMVVRRDQRKRRGGRDVVVETYYSDYRAVNGVMQPFRIQVRSGGRTVTETEITEMVANPEMPADFFAPPVADWPRW